MGETYSWLTYATPENGIAVITLNRPRQRNAQTRGLLVELGDAFERAEADDGIRVVVLQGAGTSFSSGHDLGSSDDRREREPGPGQHPTYRLNGGSPPGVVETPGGRSGG